VEDELKPDQTKPRIAFFIDKWKPGTGTENQLQGMLAHLAGQRLDARLFTLHTPLEPEHRDMFPCPVECLGVSSLFSPAGILAFPRIVKKLRRMRFDAAMIYFLDSNLYLVPACRLAGIPAVVINRRDMGYWYDSGPLRAVNFVNRWASHFLVNAEAVKERVVQRENFPGDRISVIHNGLWDQERYRQIMQGGGGDLPEEFPTDGPVVGITASLRKVKRLDWFLGMAALVLDNQPGARFVIAGQGHLREELGRLAGELGIAGQVVFLGQVRDVPSLLKRLDVAVLTSESEGLSNSLVEYGLAGVPAVAFDVGGNGEVIREGETGHLVPVGDTAAMAARVSGLLADDERRRDMGRAAADHCGKAFSADHVGDLMMNYFHGLAAGGERDGV